MDFLPLLHL
jgi:SHS family lactate transporter-like MFS transporter